MKVKCIDNNDWPDYLTIDKTYDVIEYDSDNYNIMDDNYNSEYWYDKNRFTPLSEYRNNIINKLLADES